MDQVGLDANKSLDDLKKRQNNRDVSGNIVKAFLDSSRRIKNNSIQHHTDVEATTSQLRMDSPETYNEKNKETNQNKPQGIHNRYNCMTDNKKLKEECWRMRKVHEDKMKEFEMKWISNRHLDIPDDSYSSEDETTSPTPVSTRSFEGNEQQQVIVTPLKNSDSIEATSMRLPELLDAEKQKVQPQICIRSFTCMSPKSRRLKKEMKLMRKVTLDSLLSHGELRTETATIVGELRMSLHHQDSIGLDI